MGDYQTIDDRRSRVETYMTVKGQIVIPSKVRRRLGMKEGTRVQVDVDEGTQRIILTPITREYIEGLRGRYKGKGLLKALAAEKKRERDI
jgi:AbrB family looped-hinge helix DNA binding protein